MTKPARGDRGHALARVGARIDTRGPTELESVDATTLRVVADAIAGEIRPTLKSARPRTMPGS